MPRPQMAERLRGLNGTACGGTRGVRPPDRRRCRCRRRRRRLAGEDALVGLRDCWSRGGSTATATVVVITADVVGP